MRHIIHQFSSLLWLLGNSELCLNSVNVEHSAYTFPDMILSSFWWFNLYLEFYVDPCSSCALQKSVEFLRAGVGQIHTPLCLPFLSQTKHQDLYPISFYFHFSDTNILDLKNTSYQTRCIYSPFPGLLSFVNVRFFPRDNLSCSDTLPISSS